MMPRAAIVTVSDRASRGEYEDKGGPGCEDWLRGVVTTPLSITRHIIPDGRESVASMVRQLVSEEAALILVTGGTGPAPRDETPEGVAQVIEKELAGFGEEMRRAFAVRRAVSFSCASSQVRRISAILRCSGSGGSKIGSFSSACFVSL